MEDNFWNKKFETLTILTRSLEEILRNIDKKCIIGIENFFVIFQFSPQGKDLRPEVLAS